MEQKEWEEKIIEMMVEKGKWVLDENSETHLRFSFKEGIHHWMKDYNKKDRSFVQFDGNIKINIRCC